MKSPDFNEREFTEALQLEFIIQLEAAGNRMHEHFPDRTLSHCNGRLAATMAMSLIANLAGWGDMSVDEVARRLVEELKEAASRGGLTNVADRQR